MRLGWLFETALGSAFVKTKDGQPPLTCFRVSTCLGQMTYYPILPVVLNRNKNSDTVSKYNANNKYDNVELCCVIKWWESR